VSICRSGRGQRRDISASASDLSPGLSARLSPRCLLWRRVLSPVHVRSLSARASPRRASRLSSLLLLLRGRERGFDGQASFWGRSAMGGPSCLASHARRLLAHPATGAMRLRRVADGIIVGSIFKSDAAPAGEPWMWTLAFEHREDRTPTHGYAVTREAAMAAFAKSWRRE
jgi:hypothetical protein